MAKRFRIGWECGECFRPAPNQVEAAKCHRLPEQVYICEICGEEHVTAEDATECCAGQELPRTRTCSASIPVSTVCDRDPVVCPAKDPVPFIPVQTRDVVEPDPDEVDLNDPAPADVDAVLIQLASESADFPAVPDPIDGFLPPATDEDVDLRKVGEIFGRPPQSGCPHCGIAQSLGTVVQCACMIGTPDEEDPNC